MEEYTINTKSGCSRIIMGQWLENLRRYTLSARLFIITDVNVGKLYPLDSLNGEIITIGIGENIKTLDTVRDIYQTLIELEADRSSIIVGVGGGIVCDIAGFVASTFLRGVRFGMVATTLLAQVDAAVGGKNGVNFDGYKNMVGVFNQPDFVICDPDVLKTLPLREISSGLAEIVKHAAIADPDLFSYLEQHYQAVLTLDRPIIEKLVYESIRIKTAVVNRDEKEHGERRILNFGHTFGHAIEKVEGVAHGEAVSMGMVMASNLSVKKGLITADEESRLKNLLDCLNLPTHCKFNTKAVFDALKKDKKRQGDALHFVFLHGIGHAEIDRITIKELEDALYATNNT